MALNMSLSYSKVVLSLFSHSTNIWVCFGFVHFVLDKQQRTNFTIQRRERKLRMKYVLVTGGVVSGLGKGVTASSIGVLLKACGLRVTSIKIGIFLLVLWIEVSLPPPPQILEENAFFVFFMLINLVY